MQYKSNRWCWETTHRPGKNPQTWRHSNETWVGALEVEGTLLQVKDDFCFQERHGVRKRQEKNSQELGKWSKQIAEAEVSAILAVKMILA